MLWRLIRPAFSTLPSNSAKSKHRRLSAEPLEQRHLLADYSPPAILQWFESTYDNIENRLPDVFAAGYGSVYTPPSGRADSSNFSVGYDAYDRFDLGKPA